MLPSDFFMLIYKKLHKRADSTNPFCHPHHHPHHPLLPISIYILLFLVNNIVFGKRGLLQVGS